MTEAERNKAAIDNKGMIIKLACGFHATYSHLMEKDDFISEGYVGLVEALNSYEEGKGRTLSSYIYLCTAHHLCNVVRSLTEGKRYDPNLTVISIDSTTEDGSVLYETIQDSYQDIDTVLYNVELDYINNQLTEEERGILEWIIDGYPISHLAVMLGINRKTLSRRIASMKEKINILIEKA